MQFITDFLDAIFYRLITPVFSLLGDILAAVIIAPMNMLSFPPALQVVCVALLTALLSIGLRRVVRADEKERAFKKEFTARKAEQEELHRVTDWKSREKIARAMDDEIDEGFNTYLAGRFARYGIAYLLPIFLVMYWLESVTGYTIVIRLPENSSSISGIPVLVVFLTAYCLALFVYFRVRKRRAAAVAGAGG